MWLYQPLLPGGAQLQADARTGTASQNVTPSQTATGALAISGTASQNITPSQTFTAGLTADTSPRVIRSVSVGLSLGL